MTNTESYVTLVLLSPVDIDTSTEIQLPYATALYVGCAPSTGTVSSNGILLTEENAVPSSGEKTHFIITSPRHTTPPAIALASRTNTLPSQYTIFTESAEYPSRTAESLRLISEDTAQRVKAE